MQQENIDPKLNMVSKSTDRPNVMRQGHFGYQEIWLYT